MHYRQIFLELKCWLWCAVKKLFKLNKQTSSTVVPMLSYILFSTLFFSYVSAGLNSFFFQISCCTLQVCFIISGLIDLIFIIIQ